MNFFSIQKQRVDALMARFARDGIVPVSAEDLSRLGQLEAVFEPNDAEIARVGRRSAARTAIVKRQGVDGPEAYSVWTTADYGGYRAAYKAFIKTVYKIDPDPAFSQFEVDHLFNKARTYQDTDFVRLEAIDGKVNGRWGTRFERLGSRDDSFRGRAVGDRSMCLLIAAKLIGELPPDSSRDAGGIRRIARALRGHGLANPGASQIDPETRRMFTVTLEYQVWHLLMLAERERGDVSPVPTPPPGLVPGI